MIFRRFKALLFVIIFILFGLSLNSRNIVNAQVNNQEQAPEFQEVLNALKARRSSIKSARASFRVDTYNNPEIIERNAKIARQQIEEAVKSGKIAKTTTLPLYMATPNKVISYFWATDGERWRCDKTQFYPETIIKGRPTLDYALFDGERLFVYSDLDRTGKITGDQFTPEFISTLDSNSWITWGLLLNTLQYFSSNGTKFKFSGVEIVNGERCGKYMAQVSREDVKGDLSIWFSIEKGFSVMKYREEWKRTASTSRKGDLKIFVVNKLILADGFYVPEVAKQEFYDITLDNKIKWAGSHIFTLSEAQINKKLNQGLFDGHFPPGTFVEDSIESPEGYIIGGDASQAVENVENGVIPPLEVEEQRPSSLPNSNGRVPSR